MPEFKIQLPIRWGDVDSFGHVNNATYLAYLEECRSRWMSSVLGHWEDGETGPVVANININYRRPIHWPETIEVTLKPRPPGRSSIKLDSDICAVTQDDKESVLYADARVTLVWINKQSGEPIPLPEVIRETAEDWD